MAAPRRPSTRITLALAAIMGLGCGSPARGGEGDPCFDTDEAGACDEGLACVEGVCVAGGAKGQPCIDGTCGADLACVADECVPGGGYGQPCIDGTCGGALACRPSDHTCVGVSCRSNVDCAGKPSCGSWSTCTYADECAEGGTETRSCTPSRCDLDTLACVPSTSQNPTTESRSCGARVTQGKACQVAEGPGVCIAGKCTGHCGNGTLEPEKGEECDVEADCGGVPGEFGCGGCQCIRLCPSGQYCRSKTGTGTRVCLDADENPPAGVPTGCSSNPDCPDYHNCFNKNGTGYCLQLCGTCPNHDGSLGSTQDFANTKGKIYCQCAWERAHLLTLATCNVDTGGGLDCFNNTSCWGTRCFPNCTRY